MWTRGSGSKNMKLLFTSYLEAPFRVYVPCMDLLTTNELPPPRCVPDLSNPPGIGLRRLQQVPRMTVEIRDPGIPGSVDGLTVGEGCGGSGGGEGCGRRRLECESASSCIKGPVASHGARRKHHPPTPSCQCDQEQCISTL